ncbi:tail fiber domain-containing protein [Achromobacter sp. ACM02]|uniref:pyocin knob domain-containing S74 family peptidase n=1 Tax=Achromobacter sp. ACM02 TaxID=2769305 RepID=UPI00177E3B1E|nr:pyocin knob domain-containing S74 family peptidase [Achromobacter sp. ACM02]MBD9384937.1 tail fiber domain-containing protein [Achromobacter sp. ACM02]
MVDYSQYEVDLDSPQPGGRRGESPRSAFKKKNDFLYAVQEDMNKAVFRNGSLTDRNLNNVYEPGDHNCPYTADATPERNYPTKAAGKLRVTRWGDRREDVIQEYMAIDNTSFYRFNYSGWNEWQRALKSSASQNRILLDGPQATHTAGTAFQTTTPAALTWLNVVPGSAGLGAGFHAFARPTGESEYLRLACGTLVATFATGRTGVGPNYPRMDFNVDPFGLVMRLDPAGGILFGGEHVPQLSSRVSVSFEGGGQQYGIQMRPRSTVDTTYLSFHNSAGTQIGHISANGATIYYSTTSDRRAKDEIEDAPLESCVERLLAARVRDYRLLASGERFRGFIADELQAAFRQAVIGEPNDMMQMPGMKEAIPKFQSVDPSKMVPDLTGGFQWLHQRFQEMADRIAAQDQTIAELVAQKGNAAA